MNRITLGDLASAGYKAYRKAAQRVMYENPRDHLSPPIAWHSMSTHEQLCWIAFAKEVIAQNASHYINPDRTLDNFSARACASTCSG
jgi:hypothetical protein